MTSYLLNFMLCSGALLLVYRWLLEGEKMLRFNRFYLLTSLVFALAFPLITVEIASKGQSESRLAENNVLASYHVVQESPVLDEGGNYALPDPLTALYFLVATALLFRFVNNLWAIERRKRAGKVIDYQNIRFVLLTKSEATFTFFNFVFVNEGDFCQHRIVPEVLVHEMAHVRQRHTCDLLFVELMRIIFWFNPFLFLYKRAIQLNHEFLADEAVLREYPDRRAYQNLLLDCLVNQQQPILTSSFNYSFTKKRFTMMTINTSNKVALAKKLALIPLLAAIAFAFATKVEAQQNATPAAQKQTAIPGEGVSQKHFDEYQAIAKSLKDVRTGKNGKPFTIYEWGTDEQRKKLDVIYRMMSDEQRVKAIKLPSIPFSPAPTQISPTQEQLTSWLDSKKYGVWLNEKRISNSELKKYKPSDFAHYSVSKLERNAINYGKHYFQIDLTTPEVFAEWRATYIPLKSIPE